MRFAVVTVIGGAGEQLCVAIKNPVWSGVVLLRFVRAINHAVHTRLENYCHAVCVRARTHRTIYAYHHGIDTDLMANNPSAMSISFIFQPAPPHTRSIIPFPVSNTSAHTSLSLYPHNGVHTHIWI